MARMLQALKNLEARAVRPQVTQAISAPTQPAPAGDAREPRDSIEFNGGPQAETLSAAVSGLAVEAEDFLPPAVDEPVREDSALLHGVTTSIDFAATEIAKLTIAVQDPVWPASGWGQPEVNVAALGVVVEQAMSVQTERVQAGIPARVLAGFGVQEAGDGAAINIPQIQSPWPQALPRGRGSKATPTGGRPAAALERAALRTLSDPIRSRPLVDLADRLQGDIKQTASKTLLLVGVGAVSASHETLLYAGMLLAEKRHGEVLLVDADLARRTFSTALEQSEERGFGELVFQGSAVSELCRPTVTSNLSFLPAGRWPQTDLSTAGARLEEGLRKLAEQFAVVLIDGGRTDDLSASTLARETDATYLVVQLGAVEAAAAQAALRDFRAAGARVLGCIAT